MSTNKSFWKRWLEGKPEKETEDGQTDTSSGVGDSLEEGLKDLSWFESGKAAVSRFRRKTQSLGEEIANSITHGAMAVFMLGILPYAAVRAYNRAPEGKAALDSFGVSIFVISVFLMFLTSTIYHSMAPSTKHKEVLHQLDHIMIYVAIAGTYTPICISVIGGALGLGLCIAQWVVVIVGAIIKALAFSTSMRSYIFSVTIYLLMGCMVFFWIPILWKTASPVTFWLIVAGGACYISGIVAFAMKFKFSHMIWHFLVDSGAICHLLAIVFFMR